MRKLTIGIVAALAVVGLGVGGVAVHAAAAADKPHDAAVIKRG